MKIAFTMMFFGFLFKMFAHRSGYHHHRSPRTARADEPRTSTEEEPEDRDWQEALRAAKREIDKLFPNPDDDSPDRRS